ncbi:MAG: MFS transporter, partial [Chloroflexia bacterium]
MATTSAVEPQAIILEARDIGERISPLAVWSWVFYDFANTIFSINVVSTYFPLLVKERGQNDAVYAYPMSAALLFVALLMPVLGAMSDRNGRRMPWLISLTLLCIAMTGVMGLVSDLWLVIGAFVIASIGYQTALVFYDALLPSVSTMLNWGKVSGLGVGLGYAGALAGLTAVTYLIGDNSSQEAFLPTALLFLIFAIPCFLFVRDKRLNVDRKVSSDSISWRGYATQLWRTLQDTRRVPGLFTFLVANFFYSDALNTVIIAMSIYSTEVIGFDRPLTVLAPAIVAAV